MICSYNTSKNIYIFSQEDRSICLNGKGIKVSFPMEAFSMQLSKSPLDDENIPFASVGSACKFFSQNPSERSKQNKALREAIFS